MKGLKVEMQHMQYKWVFLSFLKCKCKLLNVQLAVALYACPFSSSVLYPQGFCILTFLIFLTYRNIILHLSPHPRPLNLNKIPKSPLPQHELASCTSCTILLPNCPPQLASCTMMSVLLLFFLPPGPSRRSPVSPASPPLWRPSPGPRRRAGRPCRRRSPSTTSEGDRAHEFLRS